MRSYLEKFGEPDHLFEAKLLLVGEGRVGETSLAKTLTLPNYRMADDKTYKGIDIRYVDDSESGDRHRKGFPAQCLGF